MKVRASIKSLKRQPGAQVVRRRGKIYVINKLNPRFKELRDDAPRPAGQDRGAVSSSARMSVCAS